MSITTVTELWRMSATELAEAIRSRQVSSSEVIAAAIEDQVGILTPIDPR